MPLPPRKPEVFLASAQELCTSEALHFWTRGFESQRVLSGVLFSVIAILEAHI